jgi:hypothetical protein
MMRNQDDFGPVQKNEERQKNKRQRKVANDFALFVHDCELRHGAQ